MYPAAKSGTCTPLHHILSPRPPSYYWAPSKSCCSKIHLLNTQILGDPPQTIIPSPVLTPTEWHRTPDLLKQIGGIVGRNVRPITEPSCVTSISAFPPVLYHRKQCLVLFPLTELFGWEQRICCPPAGMKWIRIGWNSWRLRLLCRSGRGISMLCHCGGVWDWNQIYCRTGVCIRCHQ